MSDTIQQYKDYVITSFMKSVQPVVVASAEGCIIHDASGKDYLDCFAGISVVNAGHCNPKVIAAAKAQMDKLVHCASYIYYSPATGELAEKLAQHHALAAPAQIVLRQQRRRSHRRRDEGRASLHRQARNHLAARFLPRTHLGHALHHRQPGTQEARRPLRFRRRTSPRRPTFTVLPGPTIPRRCVDFWAQSLEEVIRFSTAGDVAAFIAEPVMGEGGIIVPPADYFREIKKVLDRHGILFICDEVQSGFGRTGKMFAIEHYGVEPDILVTAKGIADGFPLAAFTTRDEIAAIFKPGDHLSTFGGNPVSCAASIANIEFMLEEKLCEQTLEKGAYLMERLKKLQRDHAYDRRSPRPRTNGGIELVTDEKRTPATAEAEAVRDLASPPECSSASAECMATSCEYSRRWSSPSSNSTRRSTLSPTRLSRCRQAYARPLR